MKSSGLVRVCLNAPYCLQYMVSIDLSWSYTPFNQRHVEMRRQYKTHSVFRLSDKLSK